FPYGTIAAIAIGLLLFVVDWLFGVEIIQRSDVYGEPQFGDLELEGTPDGDELAQALTANTIVCYFNVNDFKKLMEAVPSLALNYAKAVSSKLRRLEDRHADLVFRDAKSRLITFIKNWARTDGNKVGDKIVLNNYLTHTDIANFISTSRQSVNVLLNELRDSGMLFYNRKRIELNNPMVWN
ncbi:MAG: Crp/Fnr family transcriptional regulator, partial [Flavisolibacter sp.]|nr:Crp/Fnr family transcriptional regulator [Flavisolibacter sp.]